MLDLTEPEIHAAYKAILKGDPTNWYAPFVPTVYLTQYDCP